MNVIVFDTETTGLNKPFVYNIGYVIYDTDTGELLKTADYVVEQIWHNLPLFNTAYYADKRPLYIRRMRARETELEKFGRITQQMVRDIKQYNIVGAYAYNSKFDEGVFEYNCDWFKCINPFDNLPIFDIRGYVHKCIAFTPEFKIFCDDNKYYTDSGNYSTTAETVYRYINNNTEYIEEHTALSDSLDELRIANWCCLNGCEWQTEYKVYSSIPRTVVKELTIENRSIGETLVIPYHKRKNMNKGNHIILD